MSGRWWRAYDEALHDPKIVGMSDRLHRIWFNCLCIASKFSGNFPDIETISLELRLSKTKTKAYISELVSRGLLDEKDGKLTPHNWNGRQFQSDNCAERVKRHREKRSAAGLEKQWFAPKELRTRVYQADGFECVYCGSSKFLSLDHKTSELNGGTHDFENLVTACRTCNGAKRDLGFDEYVTKSKIETLHGRYKKRAHTTEYRTDSVEPRGSTAQSAMEPEFEIVGEDPKANLFRVGKTILVSFGVAEKRTGALIGQWLKCRNDAAGLLAAIQFARDQNVAEPIAYISALLSKENRNGHIPGKSLSDRAREMAAEVRQRERDLGIFRPDDSL